ncbi:MAG: IS481 family transposase, partial [Dehalococcoidia bacterium]|nr:IS481 family transposase [Dehalococcoidia bacterium]
MTTSDRIARGRLTMLELGEQLKNVSEACRMMGVSRQHFYEIKRIYEEEGLEGLRAKSRRVPNLKNRVAPEIEELVLAISLEFPAYGQVRVANELRKRGTEVSPAGVRCIWIRNRLQTFPHRLKRLEEHSAREGVILTEAQVVALEKAREKKEESLEEIETHHPGFLVAQDTFYVGYLKGVGRIYQQTVIDTYSAVAFGKLYTTKTPITAADTLNDQVLPFFEEHNVPVLRMLTDRGSEYCGRLDSHPYELFLELNEIEHTRTKARHPQTNGIVERLHKTMLTEFYQVTFRKKIYGSLEELQR